MSSKLIVLFVLLTLVPLPGFAKALNIAIITDGEETFLKGEVETIQKEISVLLDGEAQPHFRLMNSAFEATRYAKTLNKAYRSPDIDIVVILGFGTGHIALVNRDFPKPTFLPKMFAAQFYGLPSGGPSGIKNLNYLAGTIHFGEELASFKSVVPFHKAALLIEQNLLDYVPETIKDSFTSEAIDQNVDLSFLPVDSTNVESILAEIPGDIDALLIPSLPRLSDGEVIRLFRNLAQKDIAVFSLAEKKLLELGALASSAPATDLQRMARTLGFNIYSLVQGEAAETLTSQV